MSNIEWTDTTWNPVIGCTPVSPGCLNCYAATMARRLEAMGKPDYAPRDEVTPERQTMPDAFGVRTIPATTKTVRIAEVRGGRAVFTGDVRCLPDRLADPLGWKKPRMVFVNSMSDLFHGGIYGQDHDDYRWVEGRFSQAGFEFLCEVVSVIRLTPRHTYQILTKRPRIMADMWPRVLRKLNISEPIPNVWLGCSVEDQKTADERIPHLLKCPAAVRFVSYEPALGPVDFRFDREVLTDIMDTESRSDRHRGTYPFKNAPPEARTRRKHNLHWVIVGGESGHDARPFNVECGRSVVRQCADAGVLCFMKQLGARPYDGRAPICEFTSFAQWVNKARSWLGGVSESGRRHAGRFAGLCVDQRDRVCDIGKDFMRARDDGSFPVRAYEWMPLRSRKGSDPSEWPSDLRVRQVPGGES